jgi:hypothetical protein
VNEIPQSFSCPENAEMPFRKKIDFTPPLVK